MSSINFHKKIKWDISSISTERNNILSNLFFVTIFPFFIVVQVQLSPFSCHYFPPPHVPPLSTLNLTPLALFMSPLYTFLNLTLSLLSPIIPLPTSSSYHEFVLHFNVSSYILLAYLFCWLGSTYRWEHIVFVFFHLAYFT